MALGNVSSECASLEENFSAEIAGILWLLLLLLEGLLHVGSQAAQQPAKLLVDAVEEVGNGVSVGRGSREDPAGVRLGSAGYLLSHLKYYYSCQLVFDNIYHTQQSMRILPLLLVILSLLWQVELKIPNPYKVLGIEQNANEDQIKEGFKKRSKKYHPDRNKSDPKAKEKFEKIVNAYELLKDPERKRMYDLTGDEDPSAQQQQHHGFGGFGGFPGGGINIEDLMRAGFFGGGQGGQGGQQRRGHTTYTFSFGGNQGMRFQF